MVKQATTVGTCCYVGCTKSFLTDKATTQFLGFPDDLEKRKKWITNCGNPELSSLAERQLRGKKICINHFPTSAFNGGVCDKKNLKELAVPIPFKKASTPAPATPTSSAKSVAVSPVAKPENSESGSAPPTVKRGRGRPPKIKQEVFIKSEPAEEESDEEKLQVDSPRTSKEKPIVIVATSTVSEKPIVAPVIGKDKTVTSTATDTVKPISTPGKSVVTPSPNKDKLSVVSRGIAEMSTEGSAKKRLTVAPGKVSVRTSVTSGVGKDKPGVPPVTPKENVVVMSSETAPNSDGWKPFAPAVEKPVDTHTPASTKEKQVVTPGITKLKSVSIAGTTKEKLVSIPGTAKEKSASSIVTPKEKSSSVQGTPKEKPVSTSGTPKEKSVSTSGTPKEKSVSALGTSKEKPVSTPGTPKEKSASTLGTPKEKPISTPGTPKEKSVSTLGTSKDKAVSALGTPKEKPVSTLGTSKEKPVGALGTPKEKLVTTLGTSKDKPISGLTAPKEKAGQSSGLLGTPKEKPGSVLGAIKDKSGSTMGKTKDKPVSVVGTSKEKPAAASSATDATKEKPLVTPSGELNLTKKNRKVTGKIRTNLAKGKPVKEKSTGANANDSEKAAVSSDKSNEKSLLVLGPPKEKSGNVKLLKDDSAAGTVNSGPLVQKTGASKDRKRKKLTKTEKDLKSKIRRIAVDIIQPNSEVVDVDLSSSSSCEDMDEDASHSFGSSDDEEKRTSVADNREFERFHKTLKMNCVLPESWNLGAVLWDPSRKMKVITASEVDISSTGSVRLKRSVQVFETMQTKVTVDGFDLTNRYDVKTASGHQDVTRLILRVARSKICCGIRSISAEDAMYFPDAVPRGTTFYSEACPVIISKQSMGPLCNSCHKLRNAIRRRKSEQKRAVEMRKAKRSSLHTVNSPFGKALYTLLSDLMADENDPKKKKKRNTLYSRGHNVCLKDRDGDGDKNASERSTNTASISYIMQDIVSKMSLGKMPQEQQSQFFKSEDDQMGMQILNGTLDSNSGNLVVQNAADFTLAEGQEYELIGEVDPNDVQVVEMIKERPNSPQIEIIEVDDHTLAQLAAQNMSGMFLQDSGQIHVNMSEVDVNNPAMSQLLKVIGPSHGY